MQLMMEQYFRTFDKIKDWLIDNKKNWLIDQIKEWFFIYLLFLSSIGDHLICMILIL